MKHVISLGLTINLFTPGHPAMINAGMSDINCKPVARSGKQVPCDVRDGHYLFDPEQWKRAVYASIREVIETSGVDIKDIVSISSTAHPDNVILLDENGAPTGPGLVCVGYDFAAEKEMIKSLVSTEQMLKYIHNGFGIGSMVPTAQILLWHKRNTPEVLTKCRHVLVTKDFFTYCLTGKYTTEHTDASFSMLYDPVAHQWSAEMAEVLGIDPAILPQILSSGDLIGYVTPEAAAATGLSTETKVLAGATNKACVELLSMSTEDTEAVYSYSIFSNLVVHATDPVVDPSGNTALCCSMLPNEYYLMLDNRTHCYAFNWFGSTFIDDFVVPRGKVGLPYEKTENLAANSPIGANGVRFLPYLDGEEAPVFDPNAKGVFLGITLNTTKADMMRAVMEGTAFSARETFEYVSRLGIQMKDMHHRIMGSEPMMTQMLADITGYPVKLLRGGGPNDGVTSLQCVAFGTWPTLRDAARALVREGDVYMPDPDAHARYEEVYQSYKRLYPALKGLFSSGS